MDAQSETVAPTDAPVCAEHATRMLARTPPVMDRDCAERSDCMHAGGLARFFETVACMIGTLECMSAAMNARMARGE